jgi:cell fate regulator YaaT (PSP1 superfamily)
MSDALLEQQRLVAGVRFHKVGKLYHFDTRDYPDLALNDYVIVETTRGRQMGQVLAFKAADDDQREHKSILRMATPRDLVLRQYWEEQQDEVIDTVRARAKEMGGYQNVRFVAAVYNYDGSALTILYTTEDKPNMNRLWQDLNRRYASQLELRLIGPRDVAKLLGGFGACGELRCCSTFLTDFSPVSIKMAKAQGISLNPTEITGMCGRLRCCLVYEYDQYVAARAKLPKRNKRVGTPFGEGKVIDVLPLQDAVIVLLNADNTRHTIARADLAPLDELEALAKKAKEPCTKHGDGPCECGAKPGKAAEASESGEDSSSDEADE